MLGCRVINFIYDNNLLVNFHLPKENCLYDFTVFSLYFWVDVVHMTFIILIFEWTAFSWTITRSRKAGQGSFTEFISHGFSSVAIAKDYFFKIWQLHETTLTLLLITKPSSEDILHRVLDFLIYSQATGSYNLPSKIVLVLESYFTRAF